MKEADNSQMAGRAAFSPDSTQIAFALFRDPSDTGTFNRCDLCLMDVDGSNKRVLLDGNEAKSSAFDVYEWPPDGTKILVAYGQKTDYQLAWIYVTDGSIQTLKKFNEKHAPTNPCRHSLDGQYDGQYIAFDSPQNDNPKSNHDIFILNTKNDSEIRIVNMQAKINCLVGLRMENGSYLIATGQEPGMCGVLNLKRVTL